MAIWLESGNGLMVNPDPVLGGIIDKTIKTGEWFVIFHSDLIPTIEGLESKEKALQAFDNAIQSTIKSTNKGIESWIITKAQKV